MDSVTCSATRADGQPCQGKAGAGGFCFAHDPALREKRRAAYATGGRNKATPRRLDKLMPASLRPVLDHLYAALEETHAGELDARQASAMASLAGAIAKLFESTELESRLQALEALEGRHGTAR